jgi:hypothetical protein
MGMAEEGAGALVEGSVGYIVRVVVGTAVVVVMVVAIVDVTMMVVGIVVIVEGAGPVGWAIVVVTVVAILVETVVEIVEAIVGVNVTITSFDEVIVTEQIGSVDVDGAAELGGGREETRVAVSGVGVVSVTQPDQDTEYPYLGVAVSVTVVPCGRLLE